MILNMILKLNMLRKIFRKDTKYKIIRMPVVSPVERLPLPQVVILGSWDRVPHWAPPREPASPSACVSAALSLCISH